MPFCDTKICPQGKVCNPKTGRCIKIKQIKQPKKPSCDTKICPQGKVCNPKTIRCIKEKRKNDRPKKVSKVKTMNDKLYFYSKSRDMPAGKGANEVVEDASLYAELGKIKHWRKVLSNFHMCPFKYEGYTYNTIEHVFQAKKIEIADNDKAYLFTLESGHAIGAGDGEIARKNRKLIKLNSDQLYLWSQIKDIVMHDAAVEKYKACKEARDVLKSTNSAQLWHIVSRSQPIRFIHLEKIRSALK